MALPFATVVIGTTAAMLATILLLLRAEVHGRRPVVALTRRWVATSARNSGFVVGLLTAIAVGCFASFLANDRNASSDTSALVPSDAQSAQNTGSDSDEISPQELDALRSYAANIDAKQKPSAATPTDAASAGLPDVETMIAQLVARLEKQPDDLKGWKMLGWSYLNTGRPGDAVKAYEAALKLEPNDDESRKALDRIRSAQTPMTRPASASASAEDANGMIRGMVERLAERLETFPNDEEGWTRLMRSRMTLGETDAAKAALAKARETFASDIAAKARLTATAHELGVPSD